MDSSNIDSTDDEVCAVKEKIKQIKKQKSVGGDLGHDFIEGCLCKISDNDYSSEEKKMVANSTDEETISFPVFDEKTYMNDPKFCIGMLFCSGNSFRLAVKKHAIMHRKSVFQCRNYGRRIRFVCK